MNNQDALRLKRYVRLLEEMHNWRNAYESTVKTWRFGAGDDLYYDLSLGDFWPVVETPVWVSADVEIPRDWAGLPVELELWLGGEGFVELSTGKSGGLNPFHRTFSVASAAQGGEQVGIHAELVSKGLLGTNIPAPRLEHALLVVPEVEVRALERDLSLVVEACTQLEDHEAVPHLLDVVEAAFNAIASYWPTNSDTTITRLLQGYENPLGSSLSSIPSAYAEKIPGAAKPMPQPWSVPASPGPIEPLPKETRHAVNKARQMVTNQIECIKEEYPPVGRLALTGHAHIDLAWLWPTAETRRKARRTFSSVLELMERYEDFEFNQSSAQLYEWVEKDDPELFARIQERVYERRWEPIGGSWTEPDCQITGGESFVRQLLYGQRYFEAKFDTRSPVAWLPDVFGFSPAIPQLLRGAGIDNFFTAKLKWNESNVFPHDLFNWEGIDGSQVTAHTFRNPGTDYNGNVAASDLAGTWHNFEGKRRHPESLFSFGWGDGGGGPSEDMIENYNRLKEFPALPRLRMTRVDEFFATLPETGLPKWVGELYLELHRGTLTSQGKVKGLNRTAEHRLLEAEAYSEIAGLYGFSQPGEKMEVAWKVLLLNQFHDILPGSSIAEVYEEAHEQLREVSETATGTRDAAVQHLASCVKPPAHGEHLVLVANAGLHSRLLSAVLPGLGKGVTITDQKGELLPTQEVEGGLLVHDPNRRVPGLGWTGLLVDESDHVSQDPPEVLVEDAGEGKVLENSLLRIVVGPDGCLEQVYDKVADREVLTDRGNQLWVYVDKPREWDAWDIDSRYELGGEEVTAIEDARVIEYGPLRAAVRVERTWRDSRIVQTYRLLAGSRRVDVETEVEWHERQILLRALFPLTVHSHEATFETMYGAVRRPTHRNTSWDAARFEVSAHRFADLSEPGYGVALLNDGKYGHSAHDNVLGISLVRSPVYPDPLADQGEHRFTYSLFPHRDGWAQAGVVQEAFELNSPLFTNESLPSQLDTDERTLPFEFGLVSMEGLTLSLGSLKRAEDGDEFIIRLYEPHGARGKSVLNFCQDIQRAEPVDLLEEGDASRSTRMVVDGSTVSLEVNPFEVITVRVAL